MAKPRGTTSTKRKEPATRPKKGKDKTHSAARTQKRHASDGNDDDSSDEEDPPMTHRRKKAKRTTETDEEVDNRTEPEIEEVDEEDNLAGNESDEVP
jgi:hypothetical protein